ncbi:CRISPR-associated endonuclease Cas1 [Methanosarcinales archaeon]|nr:MAG: CRISPR-associated endonuclease Cas1 [Methanosarcinales archaeon]
MGKIFNKINWYTDKYKKWTKEEFFKKIKESVEGIKAYYSFINPREQFSEIEAHLQKRLGFLLAELLKRKEIEDKNEALSLISTIPLLNPHSEKEIKKWQEGIISNAFSIYEHIAKKEEKQKQHPQISRLASAQKQKFIKQYATEAEVIISTPGVFIGKTSQRVILRQKRKNILELPFFKVKNILVASRGVSVSSDLIHSCVKKKIPISFLNPYGIPYAIVEAPIFSMGSIAVLQIRAYETEKALELAKSFVEGKIRNQINLLKFYARSRKIEGDLFFENLNPAISKMQDYLKELDSIELPEEGDYAIIRDKLFSLEGRASNEYWRLIRFLLPPEIGFNGRRRRGANDLVNCLLNYGYGILYQRAWKALVLARLNPHISFLHAFQRNKPTLVYDFIEEFRQPIVDRAIFSMLTKGKRGADLQVDENGILPKATRDKTINAVIKRLSSIVYFRGEKIKLEDVITVQAKNLVKYLEGKQKYRPFLARY